MIKYVILVLTLGSVLHGKHVDVYEQEYSVTKTVAKRQVIQAETKQLVKPEEAPVKSGDAPAGVEAAGKPKAAAPPNAEPPAAAGGGQHNGTTAGPAQLPPQPRPAHDSVLPRGNEEREHNGALLRSLYVFLGLSVLVMGYLGFRAFRVRPGAPAPTTVRKYGVVGRRSDMEMLPLPLNEEEDDDTLFEVHQTAHGQQTR